jgi:hypothetical protein
MRTALTLAAALLVAAPVVGCGPKTPAGDGGQEGKEYDLILRSANLYWDAVRWADGERAGVFIEDVQQRVIFMDWLQDERDRYRYEDISVIQIELGPKFEKPEDGRRREATVWVRTRGFALPAQILETDRVKQGWYRTDAGWFVAWEEPDTTGSEG